MSLNILCSPGTNLLNSQAVAIKFVRRLCHLLAPVTNVRTSHRNQENPTPLNYVMSTGRIEYSRAAVSFAKSQRRQRICAQYYASFMIVGIPQIYHFGQEGLHNILVIDLLGPSLEDLFDMCGRKFSIKTVVMTAKQMLTRVQTIHEKHLIYRDIKPDNFLAGRPGSKVADVIHVVDFGTWN